MGRKKIIRHSFATYKTTKGNECDVRRLAHTLKYWGDIPKSLNNMRAFELSLLARAHLRAIARIRKLEKENDRLHDEIERLDFQEAE